MSAAELLTALGFQLIGDDPDMNGCTLWMGSEGARDILVVLPEKAHADDVKGAIYDAGQRDARDRISGKWKEFQDALKFSGPAVSWEHARDLQAARQAEMTAAQSMPKQPFPPKTAP
jgi:hypothetical protein